MKVGDFATDIFKYGDFIQHIFDFYVLYRQSISYNYGMIETFVRERVAHLFETYRHNYFNQSVIDLNQQNEQDNIMINYYKKYDATFKYLSQFYFNDYEYLLSQYEALKTKLKTNESKKYLVSENTTTNELTGSNENVAVTSNTLNTEKINQGTPVNTDIYGVGNTLSAEKGKNTNNENTTTTHANSENATSTTKASFNVNYFLTLDNYDALVELNKKLTEYTVDLLNKYFYKPFKEIFINAIDFERIERIRGV